MIIDVIIFIDVLPGFRITFVEQGINFNIIDHGWNFMQHVANLCISFP